MIKYDYLFIKTTTVIEVDYAIKAINLTKIYSNNVIGNDKVNLKIKYGENFSLLGPNGAGKTTFVRMVSTELLPTSGRLTVLGYDVVKNPMSVRKNIDVVPQEGLPVMDLTVYDHIYYFSRLRGLAKNDAKSATIRAIRELDLVDVRNRYVGGLSGGLKKRVLLATAIVHEPRLLILDEPTTGLDPAARRKLWNYLEKVKKEGTTILMTTHYVEEAERLSDRIAIINRGKILVCDRPENLVLKSKYLYRVKIYGKRKIDANNIVSFIKSFNLAFKEEIDSIIVLLKDIDEKIIVELIRFVRKWGLKILISSTPLEDIYLEIIGDKNVFENY